MVLLLKSIRETAADNELILPESEKLTAFSDSLDLAANEIYEDIFAICFSKANIFSKSETPITPIGLINTFIKEIKNQYGNDLNTDILDSDDLTNSSDSLLNIRKFLLKAQYGEIENQTHKFQMMLEGLQNSVLGEMETKAKEAKAQFQSTVTGQQFGIFTSSATTFAIYALEEMRTIAKQQQKADEAYDNFLNNLQSAYSQNLLKEYDDYIENIFKPYYKKAITNLFNNYKAMVCIDISRKVN